MSSRNVYLSPEERKAALVLSRALRRAESMAAAGETDAARIRAEVEAMIRTEPRVAPDYASISDEATMKEIQTLKRPALLLLAARVGSTRLIDNTELCPTPRR
jgi:pantoate--beta-alanine ligase